MAHVLVIDDDLQTLKALRNMLEKEGYEVSEAIDGSAGMRLCREEKMDVVITDIIMPEKEGLETIREPRRDFPDVKIIAISGGGHIEPEHYLNLASKFGAQCTLSKPFTRKELLEAVRELINAG